MNFVYMSAELQRLLINFTTASFNEFLNNDNAIGPGSPTSNRWSGFLQGHSRLLPAGLPMAEEPNPTARSHSKTQDERISF